MKKFLRMLILTISILMVSIPVFASNVNTNSIQVQLDGEYIDFTDNMGNKVEPKMINSRTMVPMRKIFEVLGAEVEWIPETKSIVATTDELEIGLQINNNVATVKSKDGANKEITLDAAPTIRNNRTLVPVRFIAESLDKKVGWDSTNRTVIIVDTDVIEDTIKKDASNFYRYLTYDFEKITSFDMNVDLNGVINMVDSADSSYDSTLNVDGKMDFKLSDTAMAMTLEADLRGTGVLSETIKSQSLENVKIEAILDIENGNMYMSSPLFVGYENKWLKYELGEDAKSMKDMLAMAKDKNYTGIDAFEEALLPTNALTINSYSELQSTMQSISTLLGNDNFKVLNEEDVTYRYKIDLSELLQMMLFGTGASAKLDFGFDIKVENNVAKNTDFMLDVEINQGTSKISVDFGADATLESYNKSVEIKMPNASDVVTNYEM